MNGLGATRLPWSFYQRDAVTVARALLGQRLVRKLDGMLLAGIITETEAYLGARDRASHTFGNRRTSRNESMYLPGGHAYVYFTYGMHHCINVVAGRLRGSSSRGDATDESEPVAVLIRAFEPTHGIERMRKLRGLSATGRGAKRPIAGGPGMVCQALALDLTHDGLSLIESDEFWIEQLRQRAFPSSKIIAGPRVGIASAGDWVDKPLRFRINHDRPIAG